jgi:hypothetical protein
MEEENKSYKELDEYLSTQEEKLNDILDKLTTNNNNNSVIKKFDRIVKSKIDYKEAIPYSKSFEGEHLLTLSQTWMIIILIKIKKGKSQQNEFLNIVNSSLTRELNDYEDYKIFFEEKCEELFSDEEAIKQINSNPKFQDKFSPKARHSKIKENYIYLLYRPNFFKKFDIGELPKSKKEEEREKNAKEKNKKYKKDKTQTSKSTIIVSNESDSNEDRGDRLNEEDMISKNKSKEPSFEKKRKKSSNKKDKKEKEKKESQNDSDLEIIDSIIDKKLKCGKNKEQKKTSAKKKIKNKKYIEPFEIESEDEDKDISEEEDNKMKKNKKRQTMNDKNDKRLKKKYELINSDEEKEKDMTKSYNRKDKKSEKKNEKKG